MAVSQTGVKFALTVKEDLVLREGGGSVSE